MNPRSTRPRLLALGAALGLALSLTACAGSAPTPAQDEGPPAPVVTEPDRPATTSVALRLDGEATAHAAPDDAAAVVAEVPARTELGSTTTLLVVDARDGWLRVLLPVRPNGTTGWVRADTGTIRTTDHRIDIDLAGRTLTLFDGERPVLSSAVAVGAPDTPTPTGWFSVTDLVETGDPDSAYGPFALGLSGHSDQLTEFAGGDGQVGIHGTNQPGSIGAAVSHGCIRLPNDVVAQLTDLVALGTPVLVR